MHPSLTHIQNDVRASELRERAERQRGPQPRRALQPIESTPAAARATAFGALFLGHGFFGREHGSHA
jgi:hypothetical protein